MSGTSVRLVSLLLLALGAVGGLVAAAQPWWRLVGDQVDASITGSDASSGLAQVLPACLVVAVLLGLVLRAPGRRVLGVLAALIGLGAAVLGGWHPRPDPTTVRQTLRQSSLADTAALTVSAWPWVYLGFGLLAAAGAVLMLLRAHTWPSRADRYSVGAAATPASADPETWWKAMDAGVDPTVTERTPRGSGDPISDQDSARVTMSEEQEPPGSSQASSPTQESTAQQPGRGSDR